MILAMLFFKEFLSFKKTNFILGLWTLRKAKTKSDIE